MRGVHLGEAPPPLRLLLLLLILVPVVWFAVVALVVAICRMAAQGDGRIVPAAADAPVAHDAPVAARNGLVVWELPATSAGPAFLPVGPGTAHGSRAARRRRLTAGHGARR